MSNYEASQLKKNIGKRIKHFRKQQKLSQIELAESVNIEMKSLSRIESGHNYPQCENLVAIARALKVAPWQFYFFDEGKNIEAMRNEIIEAIKNNNEIIPSMYQYLKMKENS
ncbi:helix-turn-helix transcriptional regulator [bacterium]|nr:helix-turn-helix transcriptional regulator [bacterium]